MSQQTKALGRIALRGDFPRELIRLLSSLRLDPFGVGGLDADLVAACAGQKDGGWMLHLRPTPGAAAAATGILCDNAYAAASIILSRMLRLSELVIVASEPTYAVVRDAVQLAAGNANVLIEGETGTGKRALTELINRASANPAGLLHVDCAVASEVARITTRSSLDLGHFGVVMLDHLAELPPDAHQALAEVMSYRRARFLATSRLSLCGMVAKDAFAPILSRQFEATLQAPSLNRRRTDLEVLARHFLRSANPLLQLDSTALTALRHYRFAGNVRELRNLMTRLAIVEGNDQARTIDRARIEGHFGRSAGPESSPHSGSADPVSGAGRRLRLVASTDRARHRHHSASDPSHPALLRLAESRS